MAEFVRWLSWFVRWLSWFVRPADWTLDVDPEYGTLDKVSSESYPLPPTPGVGTGEVEARSVVALPSTPPERSLDRRSCRLIRASSILN